MNEIDSRQVAVTTIFGESEDGRVYFNGESDERDDGVGVSLSGIVYPDGTGWVECFLDTGCAYPETIHVYLLSEDSRVKSRTWYGRQKKGVALAEALATAAQTELDRFTLERPLCWEKPS